MMGTALIFFSAGFHQKIIDFIRKIFSRNTASVESTLYVYPPAFKKLTLGFLSLFFTLNILFPLRYLCYPGELFWTEEGYRFSWRVMLMEKAGYAQFTVLDKKGHFQFVNNSDFLTPLQEKMMATQPDMILQYAHILHDYYSSQGFQDPSVYADSYVTLNGRSGRALVNTKVDLAKEKESFHHKTWILPLNDEIQGF